MNEDSSNQSSLEKFALVANEYCTLIDSLSDERPPQFYTDLELLLSRLHLAILPIIADAESTETRLTESVEIRVEKWKTISNRIARVTNNETNQLYDWHINSWNTTKPKDNYCAVRASMLWDDLADIYGDLKDGLSLWDLNTDESRSEASWEWRFNFEAHWGIHLFRAAQTVHEIRYQLYMN
ncbi:MAG: DUF5063 domain-containing protein [Phycisphaerales bacterium]|nr:DUF5063 domain-containing protein [Phycisphaerales bacterium]